MVILFYVFYIFASSSTNEAVKLAHIAYTSFGYSTLATLRNLGSGACSPYLSWYYNLSRRFLWSVASSWYLESFMCN